MHIFQTIAQPDGKLLVDGYTERAGDANFDLIPTLVRLNPDGSRDKSFGGGDGKITLSRGRTSAFFSGIALQPDGRILVSVREDKARMTH